MCYLNNSSKKDRMLPPCCPVQNPQLIVFCVGLTRRGAEEAVGARGRSCDCWSLEQCEGGEEEDGGLDCDELNAVREEGCCIGGDVESGDAVINRLEPTVRSPEWMNNQKLNEEIGCRR